MILCGIVLISRRRYKTLSQLIISYEMNEQVLTITGIRSFLAYILKLTHLKIEKEFFNRGTRK